MAITNKNINKALFWLLGISLIIRAFLAGWLEFGNDEVYYYSYALYPDLSHFDHPGMVGWVMQLFSLNLLFDSEFFLRLSSVIFMTVNTYVVYRIGKEIKNIQTGFYAALLYTASIYAFIITGIFILPDTPQNLFWFLSVWCFVRFFKKEEGSNLDLVLGGLFAGLSTLSKYSGIFIWVGVGLYILLFDRKRLRNPYLYLSVILTLVCCLPVVIWNMQNDFISFTFHTDRVGLFGKLRLDYFGTELIGEFFYNNPVNFVLIIISLIALIRGKKFMPQTFQRLLLCIALPMILLFLFFSLTRSTLPHWNAPAYNLLLFIVAASFSEKVQGENIRIPKAIKASLGLLLFIVVVGSIEIKTGFIPMSSKKDVPENKLGRDDFTLSLYGWRKLPEKFEAVRQEKIATGEMKESDAIIANNWFSLANIDYYVARPLGMYVLGLGKPNDIHKYLWMNDDRGGFTIGDDYWFITDSFIYKDPYNIYKGQFEEIVPVATIPIIRNGKTVKNVFVFMCKGLKQKPETLEDFMQQNSLKNKKEAL